jgi:hypothetical protein
METELKLVEREEETRRVEVHWSDSEWFQEWLRLARRDYQGRPDFRNETDSEAASMAA